MSIAPYKDKAWINVHAGDAGKYATAAVNSSTYEEQLQYLRQAMHCLEAAMDVVEVEKKAKEGRRSVY